MMKITDGKGVLDSHLVVPDAVRAGNPVAALPPPSVAGASGDRVQVSATGRALAELRVAVREDDAGAAERVAALRAAIASGQYRVDPTAVATSLLRALVGEHVR